MQRAWSWFGVLVLLLVSLVLFPALTHAQNSNTPLAGQVVGRDDQPLPAQVTLRLIRGDGSYRTFDTAPDGSFVYTGELDPGTYWLAVEYDSLPEVLQAVLEPEQLASTPVTVPVVAPIRLSLFAGRSDLGECAMVPLLLGAPSSAPVQKERQVIYTLLPVLETTDEYGGDSGNLYNPLWRSTLTIDTVHVDRFGHAIVLLTGEFVPGARCDNLLAREQIEQTVLGLAGISGVTVLVNDRLLDHIVITGF
ncbi:MAG: carboxypeptidase regulatory-like domain-containing protein [Chloroflexi bacterium]|nr:carboxypeptidase regulatory-like domain-containing protein [Chloroflexota bacterium]